MKFLPDFKKEPINIQPHEYKKKIEKEVGINPAPYNRQQSNTNSIRSDTIPGLSSWRSIPQHVQLLQYHKSIRFDFIYRYHLNPSPPPLPQPIPRSHQGHHSVNSIWPYIGRTRTPISCKIEYQLDGKKLTIIINHPVKSFFPTLMIQQTLNAVNDVLYDRYVN